MTLVVGALCALVTTRLLVREVGVADFGTWVFLVSLTMLVFQVGFSLNEAAGKFVTQAVARRDFAGASSHLSNILAIVVVGGGAATAALWILYAIFGDTTRLTPGIVGVMLVSANLSLLAAVVSVGAFATNRLYLREGIRTGGVLVGFMVTVTLLETTYLGFWSVVIGNLVTVLTQLAAFSRSLRSLLPEVSLRWSAVRRGRIREVLLFCFGAILAFSGLYLIRTGVLWAVKMGASGSLLGHYGIASQVGALLATSIGALAVAAGPVIYHFLGRGNPRDATRQIESFNHLGLLWGLTFLAVAAHDGDGLLSLWLGPRALDPAVIRPILLASCISAIVGAMSSPLGVFLVGSNRIMPFGVVTVIEGLLVAATAAGVMRYGGGNLALVALVPGLFSVAKQLACYFVLFRGMFLFSRPSVWVRKIMAVGLYALALWVLHAGLRRFVPGQSLPALALRVAVGCAPMIIVLFRRFKVA